MLLCNTNIDCAVTRKIPRNPSQTRRPYEHFAFIITMESSFVTEAKLTVLFLILYLELNKKKLF